VQALAGVFDLAWPEAGAWNARPNAALNAHAITQDRSFMGTSFYLEITTWRSPDSHLSEIPSASFSESGTVLRVTGHAGSIELFVERHDAFHVLRLRQLVCRASDIDQHLGIFDPILLIFRPPGHHQQVSGLGKYQCLISDRVPLDIRLGRRPFDI